jgi:biotin transporter BioY
MLSSGLVAFMFAIGVSGWVYSKMDRRLGGANLKSVMTVTVIAFLVAFVVFFTILKYFLNFS